MAHQNLSHEIAMWICHVRRALSGSLQDRLSASPRASSKSKAWVLRQPTVGWGWPKARIPCLGTQFRTFLDPYSNDHP